MAIPDTIRAVFSTFYALYFRLIAHITLGAERAERTMITVSPGDDRVVFTRKWTRSGLYVTNEGPGVLYIGFGATAPTPTDYSIKLPVDTSFEQHGHGRVFQGELRATSDASNTQAMFTETRRVIGPEAPSPREVLNTDVGVSNPV